MPYRRNLQWRVFSRRVDDHVREYTVAQYGDEPDDNVESWSAEDCIRAIDKYIKRFGKGQRGEEEQLRDMLKIAHFACLAYDKMGGKTKALPIENFYELKPGDYGYIGG